MARHVWDLSGNDGLCDLYTPGHQVHWIHFNHSMREPSVVIPVTAAVDEDALVHIDGDEEVLRWNHRPDQLRAALERFEGQSEWKPRWRLLTVPMEAIVGSARSVFSMATLDQRHGCKVIRPVDRK